MFRHIIRKLKNSRKLIAGAGSAERAVINGLHHRFRGDGVEFLGVAYYERCIAYLADESCRSVRGIQDRLDSTFFKDRLCTAGAFQLCCNVRAAFLLGQSFQIIVHHDPLSQRFVYGKLQGIVQLGQPDEENNGQIAGIHLEVEQNLKIIQDSIADVVGLINDDDRRFLFFYGQTLDLVLDCIKVLCFPVCRLRAQRCSQIPVEVIDSNCRQAGVHHFVK